VKQKTKTIITKNVFPAQKNTKTANNVYMLRVKS